MAKSNDLYENGIPAGTSGDKYKTKNPYFIVCYGWFYEVDRYITASCKRSDINLCECGSSEESFPMEHVVSEKEDVNES